MNTWIGGRRGFNLVELAAVVVVLGLIVATQVPTLGETKRLAKLAACESNMRKWGSAIALYANDFNDSAASLQNYIGQEVTWSGAGSPLPTNFLARTASNELRSSAAQAIDILRRRGGRSDINMIENWISPASYNLLILQDYFGTLLPDASAACPEDAYRLTWQSDPRNYNNLGVPAPAPPGALANADKRWAYSPSYRMPTAWWSRDRWSGLQGSWVFNDSRSFVRLGGVSSRGDVGQRTLSEIFFPAQKVVMFDEASRHFSTFPIYWNHDSVRQPLMFGDLSVRVQTTGDGNPGWDWNNPYSPGSYSYTYTLFGSADLWRPRFVDGRSTGTFTFSRAYFVTTRMGLQGTDFGTEAVSTRPR